MDSGLSRRLAATPTITVTTRTVPLLVLAIALAGILMFSQGLRVVDTVGMLVCGVVAGAALAAIAASRRKR
jgi:hypothetical protein